MRTSEFLGLSARTLRRRLGSEVSAAEPFFECLLAYIVGHARLKSYKKYRLRSHFENWAVAERWQKLRMLVESGGFLEIE